MWRSCLIFFFSFLLFTVTTCSLVLLLLKIEERSKKSEREGKGEEKKEEKKKKMKKTNSHNRWNFVIMYGDGTNLECMYVMLFVLWVCALATVDTLCEKRKVYTWGHWSGWRRHKKMWRREKEEKCYIKNKKVQLVWSSFSFFYTIFFIHCLLSKRTWIASKKKLLLLNVRCFRKRCWEQQKLTCVSRKSFAIGLQISVNVSSHVHLYIYRIL